MRVKLFFINFRVRAQLKDYIERESAMSSKFISAQKELKTLTMMLTSEDSKNVC